MSAPQIRCVRTGAASKARATMICFIMISTLVTNQTKAKMKKTLVRPLQCGHGEQTWHGEHPARLLAHLEQERARAWLYVFFPFLFY